MNPTWVVGLLPISYKSNSYGKIIPLAPGHDSRIEGLCVNW